MTDATDPKSVQTSVLNDDKKPVSPKAPYAQPLDRLRVDPAVLEALKDQEGVLEPLEPRKGAASERVVGLWAHSAAMAFARWQPDDVIEADVYVSKLIAAVSTPIGGHAPVGHKRHADDKSSPPAPRHSPDKNNPVSIAPALMRPLV